MFPRLVEKSGKRLGAHIRKERKKRGLTLREFTLALQSEGADKLSIHDMARLEQMGVGLTFIPALLVFQRLGVLPDSVEAIIEIVEG